MQTLITLPISPSTHINLIYLYPTESFIKVLIGFQSFPFEDAKWIPDTIKLFLVMHYINHTPIRADWKIY